MNLVGKENFKSLCEYVISKADKIIAHIDKEINSAIVTVVIDMLDISKLMPDSIED